MLPQCYEERGPIGYEMPGILNLRGRVLLLAKGLTRAGVWSGASLGSGRGDAVYHGQQA